MRADMHIHTVSSDGALTPQDVARRAKANGVELAVITDHDTVNSYAQFKKCADREALKTVTGIEISAYIGGVKFHTLGYGFDEEKLKPFCDKLYAQSLLRAQDIIEKLRKVGFDLTLEEALKKRAFESIPVHSKHICDVMLEKGYVKDATDFYVNYIDPDKPAFSLVGRPAPEEAISAINNAGGIAVVAHPGRIHMPYGALSDCVKKLSACGLGGIEVYYTTHTVEETAKYGRLASSLGLFKTGGSDTHYFGGSRDIGKPVYEADEILLERLSVE